MKRRKAIQLINKRVEDLFNEVKQICGVGETDIAESDLRELTDIKNGLEVFVINYLNADDLDFKRTVLFRHGMSNDAMLVLTDATTERIEKLARLEETQERGIGYLVACLEVTNYCNVLFDSEEDNASDIDYLSWDISFDLSDYWKSRFKIIKMKKITLHDKVLLEATVDLNGQGDIIYVYLGDEAVEIEDMKAYGRNLLEVHDEKIYEIDIRKLLTPKEIRELHKQMCNECAKKWISKGGTLIIR